MNVCENMETLPLFARFIARTMGLHFSSERLPELEHKMAALARDAGSPDLGQYLLRLMSEPLSQELKDTLASTLTIGETYFLRDPRSYQVLVEEVLPQLIAARRTTDRTLRIWSAGCSTGEEPYSIAILLSRIIPDLANWKITVLASDINPQALERGRLGIYSKWSFRNAPSWLMSYFTELEDGRFEITPRIREMVQFRHVNLADEGVFGGSDGTGEMDIIFCRNVMIYFHAAQIQQTVARFHAALKETGWLFVGPTEVEPDTYQGFSCRQYDGAFVLCKGAAQQEGNGTSCLVNVRQQAKAEPAEIPAAALHSDKLELSAVHTSAAPAPASGSASPDESQSGQSLTRPKSRYDEAAALYQAGHYEQAADRALSGVDDGHEQADTLALGARAYANIGRLEEARECCDKAIACDRLNPHNHYLLSIILEQQGDAAGAVESLKHALFIDHDYLLAYFALGNLSRQCGEHRESERCFTNALRLLERRDPHEVLTEAEGMTAGRLAEIIRAMR